MKKIFSKQNLNIYAIFLAAVLVAPVFGGEPSHTHEQLAVQVKQHLSQRLSEYSSANSNVNIEVVPIDNRIKLADCGGPYQFHVKDESLAQSYVNVRVSCPTNEWYLFTSAKLTKTRSVLVTAEMMSPGTLLTAQNMTVAQIEENRLRSTVFESPETLIGARIKRRVRPGQPIQANMLCFICKGDRITIVARGDGMMVKTAGIAMQDGVIGDAIRVQNASSQKSLVAKVAGTQEVVVHL